MLSLLRRIICGLWIAPKPAPTLESDWATLQHSDGLPTLYLSLEERRSLDRLCQAGWAERKPVAFVGPRIYHHIRLLRGREGQSCSKL